MKGFLMQVELWPIDRPKPYGKNPRKLTDKAIGKVAASIKQFGFQQPIVCDAKDEIIVGHTRLQGAQKLGLKQVPVVVADNLTPAQVKAYRIADNRVAQETSWLDDVLADELLELKGLDFDLGETGFDLPELDRLMRDNDELERAEETPPVPETPVSVLGDLWLLGSHRILCGDSTVATDVERVLGGVRPHLMVSDPPYGVVYDANWRNEAERANGRSVGARATGKVLNDDKADWRETWALFPGDVAYIWHAGVHAGSVQQSLEVCGFAIRSQIIWAKNNIAIGRGDYHWQHEPAFYAVRTKTKGHWNGDRKQSTLWKIDKPQKSETGHSTQKPVECMLRPIQNNSSPGQAVYEPFAGSFTTGVACELSGRICLAVELSPAYVDVGVLRWQGLTGKEATLESTGETFAMVKEKRLSANVLQKSPNDARKRDRS
jgi:DNA modification methylase